MNIKIDINVDKILSERGMGKSDKVRIFLAEEVGRLSDKYVPKQQGDLMKYQRASDGSQLIYSQPYAHYQYYGQVMGGRAPKHYTGDSLTYNGAPMRGARWTERMMADKRDELVKNVEKYVGG